MVYVPVITKTLYRRKGGGGKGGGGGGGGGKSGSSGSSSGGTKIRNDFKGLPAGKNTVTTYGKGGGPITTIQSGAFPGRTAGGGSRGDVFGNRSV